MVDGMNSLQNYLRKEGCATTRNTYQRYAGYAAVMIIFDTNTRENFFAYQPSTAPTLFGQAKTTLCIVIK